MSAVNKAMDNTYDAAHRTESQRNRPDAGQNKQTKKKKTRKENAQTMHIQVQKNCNNNNNNKIMLVMSLKYIPVTQSMLCLIFLMCVATMHH